VEEVFRQHKRRYGQRRILADLQEAGHSIGRHRVRVLMRQ
jgi:putative transposase